MNHGSPRRSWRKLLRVGVPRAALLLALLALAGSIADADLARAAGPFEPVLGSFDVERSCADAPLPGYAACFALRLVQPEAQVQALAAVSGYGPADLQSA